MKKIGAFRLGFTFAGCFLGAGYVSGQELWQFFGRFGAKGIAGLLLAVFLLGLIGFAMLRITEMSGIVDTEQLIAEGSHPLLHGIIAVFEIVFLFGVSVIMTAGAGALCSQMLGLPLRLCCLAFSVIIMLTAFAGLRGMVAAFSATVPVLVLATLAFGIFSVVRGGIEVRAADAAASANPLLLFWPLAAVAFSCYNVFCSVAIMAPLGAFLKSRKTVYGGIAVGWVVLLVIAFSVLFSVWGAGTEAEALPMLSMALDVSAPLGAVYALLLFLAMFGSCLSNLIALLRVIGTRWAFAGRHKVGLHLAATAIIFACSMFGFGDLIGVLYPIFGYCSSVFIVMLLAHYVRLRRCHGRKTG